MRREKGLAILQFEFPGIGDADLAVAVYLGGRHTGIILPMRTSETTTALG